MEKARGERAEEVRENSTRDSGQASRDRALLAPTGVRADQFKKKGTGTYWKVKGLEKNMKESTMVMAFLPVVTAEEKQQNKLAKKKKSQQA